MYVVAEHEITDPAAFWGPADRMLTTLPPALRLLHSFARADGTKAVCLWEADSVGAVREFIEPRMGTISRNEYFEVPNREGIAIPAVSPSGAARA